MKLVVTIAVMTLMATSTSVFATKTYNSSKSNTSFAIAKNDEITVTLRDTKTKRRIKRSYKLASNVAVVFITKPVSASVVKKGMPVSVGVDGNKATEVIILGATKKDKSEKALFITAPWHFSSLNDQDRGTQTITVVTRDPKSKRAVNKTLRTARKVKFFAGRMAKISDLKQGMRISLGMSKTDKNLVEVIVLRLENIKKVRKPGASAGAQKRKSR